MVGMLIFSCDNDFLDLYPGDQLSEPTFWQNENDVILALAGCYSGWENDYDLLYMDAASDNGYNCFSWRGFEYIANGLVSPSSGSGSNRTELYFSYSSIRKCNYFLENIDKVDMDETKKNIYKAEVRFLRAYDYYRKVIWFGGVPLVTNVISDPTDTELPRDSKEDVVNFVLNELDEIAQILPKITAKEAGGHITVGAALTLKARLELYEGRYQEAMASAKEVVDMDVYQLFPSFFDLFQPANERNQEVILDLEYIENDFPSYWRLHDILPGRDNGNNGISSTHSLVQTFECIDGLTINESPLFDPAHPFKNRDPRLAQSILYSGLPWNGRYISYVNELNPDGTSNPEYAPNNIGGRTGYGIHKGNYWVPSAEKNNQGANWIVMRLAEVYLTYAEAAIETNQITNAVYEALDAIRLRAGMPPVDKAKYNTQEKLRELVHRERRVELAWEGLRYQDIKRWNLGPVALNGPIIGSYKGTLNENTGEVTWNLNEQFIPASRTFLPERNYLMPIPQQEMDANPNMIQNPGY